MHVCSPYHAKPMHSTLLVTYEAHCRPQKGVPRELNDTLGDAGDRTKDLVPEPVLLSCGAPCRPPQASRASWSSSSCCWSRTEC